PTRRSADLDAEEARPRDCRGGLLQARQPAAGSHACNAQTHTGSVRAGISIPALVRSTAETVPVVRRGIVDFRPDGHNARWIDGLVAGIVVRLDVLEIDRLGHSGNLVEVADIVRKARIVRNPAQIAFEMADIDRVKAHQCREQPPVCFGYAVANQIALA